MPKKLVGTKRLHEEEKKIAQTARTIRSMMSDLGRTRGSPHEMHKLSEMLLAKASDGIDHGYIKTILFPELYSADIPQPMSTQSYCRFTDKKELSIVSGGEGMLIWYPKVNNGPQIFMRTGETTAKPLNVGTGPKDWKYGGFQSFDEFFSMTTLVAASISIQYIGQLQNEQGYMVASQSFGVNPDMLSADEIENGQFRALAKPGDGMRTTYIPKDMNDFQYTPCTPAKGIYVQTRNGNSYGGSDELETARPTVTTELFGGIFAGGVIDTKCPTIKTFNTATPPVESQQPSFSYKFTKDSDFIAIYWKGLLVTSAADLRIDIVRKFNGFPKAEKRDILDLNKPKKVFDPKKTIDVIQELQTAIPQVVTHSLKQMDRVSDQIQEFLPNLGHLYNEGMLKDGTSLEGFAQQLQQISGNEGSGTMAPVRIY